MKAIITAGGKGTRLRPITYTSNKHLIPIANKPMIAYAIDAVVRAGIKDIGIVTNPDTGEEMKQALTAMNSWGANFTFINQVAPIGLAHVVKVSRSFIEDEPFVFYLGDNVIVRGLDEFLDSFQKSGDNVHLVLARVKDPQRFGVAEIRNGLIVNVDEKPANPKSEYAVTGIYFYDKTIFEAVENIEPSARGELEISDAHQYLIEKGYRIGYSEATNWWKDTGKPEDLLEANRLVLDQLLNGSDDAVHGEVDEDTDIAGKVIIEEGARVTGSSLRGPLIIGRNCSIENSYIGPYTAIDEECRIKDSEVEYSVVMKQCNIIDADIRIERSLLGRGASIIKGNSRPRTQRFIIGDRSTIVLT